MPHFRVDDALHSHPKAQRAGDEALGMWSRAGSFCMAYLTDGFVPDWWVKQQPKGPAKAKRLVEAGLWHSGALRDGEKGWQFHEFTGPGRQDSRAQIEAEREKWRKKKAAQRLDTPRDSTPMSTLVSPVESPRDTRVESPQGSLRVTRDPTQPNPTEELSGYVSQSATEPDAHGISATPGAELVRELISDEHPAGVRTMLRLRTNELLKAGHSRSDVAASLELWLTKPSLGPNALASVLSEVIKTRAAPAGGRRVAASDAAFASVQSLKNGPADTRLEILP